MITKEEKAAVIKEFARKEGDVGSPEVQVAILTTRIVNLTGHMKKHIHDYGTKRGLIHMVDRRKKLISYLKKENHTSYLALIEKLGLRK